MEIEANVQIKTVEERGKKGISGSTLKIIAIVTMLIDHIGAAILEKVLLNNGMLQIDNIDSTMKFGYYAYFMMRMIIGRISFPIFCFLLVEGFLHTKNVKKYAIRLGIFALISEIPFDLAFFDGPFDWEHQNIFFTLLIGLLVMASMEAVEAKENFSKILKGILKIVCFAVGLAAAELLMTDYAALGVTSIVVLYFFRQNKKRQILAGCISFLWEPTALLGFIPIGFYNGKRGINLKYIFYAFYPVHLILLYFIAVLMKLI